MSDLLSQRIPELSPIPSMSSSDIVIIYDASGDETMRGTLGEVLEFVNANSNLISGTFKPVTNIVALKNIDTTNSAVWYDEGLIKVKGLGLYSLDRASTLTPDDDAVIQPIVGVGRWIKEIQVPTDSDYTYDPDKSYNKNEGDDTTFAIYGLKYWQYINASATDEAGRDGSLGVGNGVPAENVFWTEVSPDKISTIFGTDLVQINGKAYIQKLAGIAIQLNGTNNYTKTTSYTLPALSVASFYIVWPQNTNTDIVTLNLNGTGVKGLKKNVTDDLAPGEFKANQRYLIGYDGTNYQMIGGVGGGGTWGSITGTLSGQTDLQAALDNKVDKVTGKSLVSDTEITKLASISGTNTGDETATSIVTKIGDGSKISSAYLPSYVDDVLEGTWVSATVFNDELGSPYTLAKGIIYVDTTSNLEYRWSGSALVKLVASPGSSDAVPEGTTNLYFTTARVLSTVLASLNTALTGAPSSTDTVLQAFGRVSNFISNIATTIRGAVLTGIVFTDSSAGVATDTILQFLGKLQAQITTKWANITSGKNQEVIFNDNGVINSDSSWKFDKTNKAITQIAKDALNTSYVHTWYDSTGTKIIARLRNDGALLVGDPTATTSVDEVGDGVTTGNNVDKENSNLPQSWRAEDKNANPIAGRRTTTGDLANTFYQKIELDRFISAPAVKDQYAAQSTSASQIILGSIALAAGDVVRVTIQGLAATASNGKIVARTVTRTFQRSTGGTVSEVDSANAYAPTPQRFTATTATFDIVGNDTTKTVNIVFTGEASTTFEVKAFLVEYCKINIS